MSTSRPARANQSKVGIALAGGGFLGAIYELGSLAALAESIDGLDLRNLDIYVGVSAGAFICAGLANGLSPHQMVRRFVESEDTEIPIDPATMMNPDWQEWLRAAKQTPKVSQTIIKNMVLRRHRPLKELLWEALDSGSQLLPRGIMEASATERKLAKLFSEPGKTDSFKKLKAVLRVVATDLDSGESIEFGSPGLEDVPISTAIRASSAVPGLFVPVEINGRRYVDGALNKTLHASVALQEGAQLVLCLNPLVPWADNKDAGVSTHLSPGLPAILSQSIRTAIRSRMATGLARYRVTHPNTDVLLFEPKGDDAVIFKSRLFSFHARRALCEHVYQRTRQDLRDRQKILAPIFAKHGMSLNLRVLNDPTMTLVRPRPRPKHTKPKSLDGAVHQLRFVLEDLDKRIKVL